MFFYSSAPDRCHLSVFTYRASVYVTASLNKPQMDIRARREVPRTSYSLHRAPRPGSLCDVKQTAAPDKVYDTRFWNISNKFMSCKHNRGSTSCQQICGHFAFSAAQAPLSPLSAEEIQMLLGWTWHCPTYPVK